MDNETIRELLYILASEAKIENYSLTDAIAELRVRFQEKQEASYPNKEAFLQATLNLNRLHQADQERKGVPVTPLLPIYERRQQAEVDHAKLHKEPPRKVG